MKNVLKIKNPETGEFEPIASISGADGAPGKDGQGVPTGGTTGQVLRKTGSGDYEAEWSNSSGDSEKLGGVAAGLYARKNDVPAYNLLDNSDFRNPVNQRGATSYSGVAYGVDRWLLGYSTMAMQVNSGYITLTNSDSAWHSCLQRFPKGIITIGKTYTAAFGFADGTILSGNAVIQDGVENRVDNKSMSGVGIFLNCVNASYDFLSLSMVGGSSRNLVWAALYEGAYDASTLPAYVPKGYAAELAECQRYYQIIPFDFSMYNVAVDSSYPSRYQITFPQEMRIAPTVSFSESWSSNVKSYTSSYVSKKALACSVSANSDGYTEWHGSIALSADL